MSRKAMIRIVCSLRRLRDISRKDGGPFARGMAAGYQHSAMILWTEWREENS